MAPITEAVDPGWKGLFRVGGVSLMITGIIYLIGAVFSLILGPPPSSAELYLKSIAGHTMLAGSTFGLFALADFLPVPAILALYISLKGINRNAMLVATVFVGLFIVLDLGVTELNSLALVTLTQNYAAATSEAQRAAIVAAAEYALATLTIGTFFSYIVSSIGFLITGLVMLKGIFSRSTAYLGIAVGIAGILGGFYVFVPALAILLVPSLILFGLWSLFVGYRLITLGKR